MKKKTTNNLSVGLLMFAAGFSIIVPVHAQAPKPSVEMTQMLDYSRPGTNHELLNKIAGSWSFQDAKLVFVKGTLTRKPIFNGRFFSVEMTGGKLPVPVANGQMKEGNYQEMHIEGYDNPRMTFVTAAINNHIGSDIEMQTGSYDASKSAFTYEYDSELIKGQPKKNRRILTIKDANHYIEEYYEQRNGEFVKVRELDYTKTSD